MLKGLYALLAAVLVFGALADPAAAQRRGDGDRRGGDMRAPMSAEWEEIGCVEVGRRPDRDFIEVGRRDGRYSAIRLRAEGNDVEIQDFRVIYANGQPDGANVRAILNDGAVTTSFDLIGRERAIDRIELVTNRAFRGRGRGPARLCAIGLKAEERRPAMRPAPVEAGWEQLGCVEVSRRPGFDTINVGRRDGRYRAIRLVARYRDVFVDDVRVIYANGQPDDLGMRTMLRDGTSSERLSLAGFERAIDRIEIATRKASREFGRGELCVLGLKVEDRRPGPAMRAAPVEAGWEQLGCVDVGRRPDRDFIEVGRREGRYRAIRLRAEGNDVELQHFRVVYANGQPDGINVRAMLREGDSTRPFDLMGRERAIDRIELVTNRAFRGRGRGPARLCAFGLKADDRRPDMRGAPLGPDGRGDGRGDGRRADWEELGCKSVSFVADHDTIPVGRQEGRFKALRIRAMRNDIHINRVKVNYADGESEVLVGGGSIRAGQVSAPLDLTGRRRAIRSVDLVMNTKIKGLGSLLKGEGKICVEGLQ